VFHSPKSIHTNSKSLNGVVISSMEATATWRYPFC
jgi:hypothetical protein